MIKTNEKELKFILQEGEGLKIEFKESFDKSLAKEMAAFANSEGGRIFLGVTDDGEVKEIKINNKLKSQIQDIANNCDPSIKISLEEFNHIMIINVYEGHDKPYRCGLGFFLRVGPNSQKLKRDEIIAFSIGEGRIRFDSQINKKFERDDFDIIRFRKYLNLINIKLDIPMKDMLFNLGLCDENFQYNNACAIFFAKKPRNFFQTSKVVCVNYQGNEKVKILDRKEFDNGILRNIEEAVNYVQNHINVEYEIKKLARKEIPQYPEEAIREIIVNAIMHRDYFDNSGDILIEVFRNKLMVSNPGGLVKGLKPKDFGKISRARNPIVASLLARTSYVEKLGTGINRIKKAMEKAGLPSPVFEYNSSFFVTLYDMTYLHERVTKKVTERVTKKVTENQRKILDNISKNSLITVKELSKIVGISERKIKENISKLKQENLLKRIGPARGGHWKVIENQER